MTPQQFEEVLNTAAGRLTDRMRLQQVCRDPKEFEELVLNELKELCGDTDKSANPTYGPHAFPDVLVNGFGVEVKHTIKDSWLAVGNSIFEGQRDKSARKIYVVYGKMGGWPEVRWKQYEHCISHVRISHAPRFVIEMERPTEYFRRLGIEYEQFCDLSPVNKMEYVRQYARDNLRQGEQLWWLESLEEQTHSLPIAVQVYRDLPDNRKRQLRAEATLLVPEVVKSGSARGKYDRAALYFIIHHGVLTPQVRDLFTAGSVGARQGRREHKYIVAATQDIEPEMLRAARELDDSLFVEYWGHSCRPQDRIKVWLEKADALASDWRPSNELFRDTRHSPVTEDLS